MSFPHALTVGKMHFPSTSLRSFALFCDSLAVDVIGGVSIITGLGLEYCAIDLVMGACDALVESTDKTPITPLGWRIDSVRHKMRFPDGRGSLTPFQPQIPDGWLLFESARTWHFLPLKSFDAVGYRERELVFIFGGRMMRLRFEAAADAEAEFDALRSRSHHSRHYTMRADADYAMLRLIPRLHCQDVRLGKFDQSSGLESLRLDGVWIPGGSLPTPTHSFSHTPPSHGIGR